MTYELFSALLGLAAQFISAVASLAVMFRCLRRPWEGLTRLDAFLMVLAMPTVMS